MVCWSFTLVPRGAPFSVETETLTVAMPTMDQPQVVTHIMTHRSEYFAGKTQSIVAVKPQADTTTGGWAMVYEQMALVGVIVTVDDETA